jgi:hypothetical protein
LKNRLLQTFILIFLAQYAGMGQCMLVEQAIPDMVNHSATIIEGVVGKSECVWDKTGGNIYTLHEVEVYSVYKGNVTQKIIIATEGGVVDDHGEDVTPSLHLEEGQSGIFFLKPAPNLLKRDQTALPVYLTSHNAQSFFEYDKYDKKAQGVFKSFSLSRNDLERQIEAASGQRAIRLSLKNLRQSFVDFTPDASRMAAVIASLSPSTITAGTESVLTITGSGFGNVVGGVNFRWADSSSPTSKLASPVDKIITWTDTEIKVKVPAKAGTGNICVTPFGESDCSISNTSSPNLVVRYAHTNTSTNLPLRLSPQSNNGKITFTYNTSFNDSIGAKTVFARALSTWKCTSDMNIEINTTTSTSITRKSDGVNLIAFNELDTIAGSNSSVLGITFSYSSPCGSPSQQHLIEQDIIFDKRPNWNYTTSTFISGKIDFETVALHELGHALMQGHVVNSTNEVMFPIISVSTPRVPHIVQIESTIAARNKSTLPANSGCSKTPLSLPLSTTISSLDDISTNTSNCIFSITAGNTISPSSTYNISRHIILRGASASNKSTLSGNNTFPLFTVSNGSVLTLQNLNLNNAYSSNTLGAVNNSGLLKLNNVTFNTKSGSTYYKPFTMATSAAGVLVETGSATEIK